MIVSGVHFRLGAATDSVRREVRDRMLYCGNVEGYLRTVRRRPSVHITILPLTICEYVVFHFATN